MTNLTFLPFTAKKELPKDYPISKTPLYKTEDLRSLLTAKNAFFQYHSALLINPTKHALTQPPFRQSTSACLYTVSFLLST